MRGLFHVEMYPASINKGDRLKLQMMEDVSPDQRLHMCYKMRSKVCRELTKLRRSCNTQAEPAHRCSSSRQSSRSVS